MSKVLGYRKQGSVKLLEHRVTLKFSVDSGNQYLYDDATGMTFVWSDLREQVLSALLDGSLGERRATWNDYAPADIDHEVQFISRCRQKYGAFVRKAGPYPPVPPPAELEAWIRKEILMQLILVVTEDCNLRCRYCAFSDHYPLNRSRTTKSMTFDLARRAVDYFFELARPERERNPRRLFGVTFYGGEPLLEVDLIARVIDYARERFPGLVIPVMTVNGTLLSPEVAKTLADREVHISISLDGPTPEQDRNRVFPSGQGSYEPVMRNLRRIREEMPDFFANYVTSVSTYDCRTDVEAVSEFFFSSPDPTPPVLFVSKVATRNTDYYDAFGPEDLEKHIAQVRRLRQDYKRRVIEGERYSTYAQSYVGLPIATCLLRGRMANPRPPFLPFTGACIPGTKLCVTAEGQLDVCERVNGSFPIGHLDSGGIDFGRVKQVIESYRDSICDRCHACPVTRLCAMCYSTTEQEGAFAKTPEDCAETVAITRGSLADYYSIKEGNPSADFSYETDRTYLERRLMFL